MSIRLLGPTNSTEISNGSRPRGAPDPDSNGRSCCITLKKVAIKRDVTLIADTLARDAGCDSSSPGDVILSRVIWNDATTPGPELDTVGRQNGGVSQLNRS